MIKIKTRKIIYVECYSNALFNYDYNAKEKMILEDNSYITRTVDHLSNPQGTWTYYNKKNKFIRQISIDEYPFCGVIPESGDEEDDQYGVIYTAEVDITYDDFEKEKLNSVMLKKVQERMDKHLTLPELEKGLKLFFLETIEAGEKGWYPNMYWLPYTI